MPLTTHMFCLHHWHLEIFVRCSELIGKTFTRGFWVAYELFLQKNLNIYGEVFLHDIL